MSDRAQPSVRPRLAVPAGLCADCRHAEIVASDRAAYVLCGLARLDPSYPRYPRLPVEACRGFRRGRLESCGAEASAGSHAAGGDR